MNTIRNISAVLLLSSLALTALPAGAVSFGFVIDADRVNTAGTTTTVGPLVATHFCYLSRVGVENTDSSGETATCRLNSGGGTWILEANLARNDDADARCSATCYTNN
jgi:hypothetical protein